MKKILALVLALLVALSMTAAFAADGDKTITPTNIDNPETVVATSNTFDLTKKIALFNTDSEQIYEPNVKYTYAVANVNPNSASVTDDEGNRAVVKTGMGGVTISYDATKSGGSDGIYFGQTDAKFETNAEGVVSTATKFQSRTAAVTVDTSVFVNGDGQKQPGIYRYSITETMTDSTSGVIHNVNEPLYMDVYVRFNEAGTDLEVYGIVLFRDTEESTSEKVTGFDDTSDENGLVDEYHTYNMTITKTVSGSLGDKNNNFPFQADLSGTNGNAELWYVANMDGNTGSATKATLSGGAATIGSATTSGTVALQNNDTLVINGIPVGTSVKVTEYNNTADKYTATLPTVTAGNSDDVAINDGELTAGDTADTTVAMTVVGTEAGSYENTAVTFNNELSEVSPTGVVLRFAPYIAMLAGGVLLLVLARKRRSHKDED